MPAMFSDSLFASASTPASTRSRKTVVASIAIQTALVATILTLPILHPDGLPLIRTAPASVIWRSLQKPVPPPRLVPVAATSSASNSFSVPALPTASVRGSIGRPAMTASDDAPSLFNAGSGMAEPAIPTFIGGPSGGSVSVHPGPGGAGVSHAGPVKISSGVTAGLLIAPIHPVYPRIALAARQQGTVTLAAIIDRNGNITALRVVSGPEMLRTAALDAVRVARYRPFLLNGAPTEVDTTISVNFILGNA